MSSGAGLRLVTCLGCTYALLRVQENLATAEERLCSAKMAAELAKHVAKVEAVVAEMREDGEEEHQVSKGLISRATKPMLVLDLDSEVNALAVFKDPATSAPRIACGREDGKVRVFDAVSGGDALLVLDAGDKVNALVVFEDLATGALRLASGTGKFSRLATCESSTRSRAARRWSCSRDTRTG